MSIWRRVLDQAILGFRADLIVLDDPIRSREDAMSEVIRRNTWEWYGADLKTRLKPGGRIVLISTRWHEDDLAGRLLAEMDKGGDRWETLILPAIAEEGDPLGGLHVEPVQIGEDIGAGRRDSHLKEPPIADDPHTAQQLLPRSPPGFARVSSDERQGYW